MAPGILVNARLTLINFIHETSPCAKVSCILLSLFYVLSFIFDPVHPFGITPGNLIPPNFWIWTILTHQFVEVNLFQLVISFIVLIHSSRILEPLWGFLSFVTFFAIVTIMSGLLSGAFYLVCYMFTFDLHNLFDVHIYGLAGYLGGFLVAVKQCRGEQMLIGSIGLYMKHLPLVYLALTFLLWLPGLIPNGNLCLAVAGTLVSWLYLRFYQSHSRGRGDGAESFAFKTFFPKPLDGPMGTIGDTIFIILLKVKLCRKTSYRYDVSAPSKITITISSVEALDAERRRNKAIKALDERLQKAETSVDNDTDWPELDGDGSNLSKTSNPLNSHVEDMTSNSESSHSDIVRIDMEPSSPSD